MRNSGKRAAVTIVAAVVMTACDRPSGTPEHAQARAETPAAAASVASTAEVMYAAERHQGIVFHAMGQEPGWLLKLDEQHHAVFAANSMDDSVIVPVADPVVDPHSGAMMYASQDPGHRLTIVRVPEPCRDPLNDELFDARVTVTFDGVTYQGCGRRL